MYKVYLAILLCIVFQFSLQGQGKTEETSLELWNNSIDYYEGGNYSGVIDNLNRLEPVFPNFGDLYYNRALAKLLSGDVPGSCSDFKQANTKKVKQAKSFVHYYCDQKIANKYLQKRYYPKQKINPANLRPYYSTADTLRGALLKERSCYDVLFYDLNVRINPSKKSISGSNVIHFKMISDAQVMQVDLFKQYIIDSITSNGIKCDYTRYFDAILINLPSLLKAKQTASIKITYHGKPRIAANPPWVCGFVWSKDKDKNMWASVCCEHYGASSWWPNKDHLSDKPDSMRIAIEVPGKLPVICNGNLRGIEKADALYTRYNWFVSYPINNYNVTFYWGNYKNIRDSLLTRNGKQLMVDYYVLPNHFEKAQSYFKQTLEVIDFYNKAFGDYPYANDGFGQVEAPYAGMEHQGAIAYGYSFGEDSSRNYRNKKYDPIIVHEAAHEWWGNSTNAYDMADVWLHEAFASYAELMFIENKFGYNEYQYELQRNFDDILNIYPMVGNRDVNEQSFVGGDIYMKGTALLDNLRCLLNNDSLFYGLMYNFQIDNRFKALTTDDFINYSNKYVGLDLHPFYNKFLYDTQLPVLEYSTENNSDSALIFSYQWVGVQEGFQLPICIKTIDGKTYRFEAKTEKQTFEIKKGGFATILTHWHPNRADIIKNSSSYFYTRKL